MNKSDELSHLHIDQTFQISFYQEKLVAIACDQQFVKPLADPTATTSDSNYACGDQLSLAVKLSADGETIEELHWRGNGCLISRAGMNMVGRLILGKTVSQALRLTVGKLQTQLNLENLSPQRLACLSLGLRSIQKLLVNLQKEK